jgi:hypothetical protein
MIADVLESAMLVSFGLAWPVNIVKSLRTKATTGKSIAFLFIVLIGYVFGLAAKFMRGDWNYVVFFYALNLALVAADASLYFHYRRKERQRVASSNP